MISRNYRPLILIMLVCIIFLIPFPRTITGEVTLANIEGQEVCATGLLPYHYIAILKTGRTVRVELDGFNTKKDGSFNGYIMHVDSTKIVAATEAFFSYIISMDNNPFMHSGMKGKVFIALPNRNLFMRTLDLFSIF